MKTKKMKKLFALIMALMLVLTLSGCSCSQSTQKDPEAVSEGLSENEGTDSQPEETDEEKETKRETKNETRKQTESEAETEPEDPRKQVLQKYRNPFLVTADLLNVREQPDTNAPVIGTIALHGAGEILDKMEDAGWAHIRSGEVEGYVSSEFIVHGQEAAALAAEYCSEGILITEEVVNARETADKNANVLTKVQEGEVYPNLGTSGEFYHTQINGVEAYVHTSCAEETYYLPEAMAMAYTPAASDAESTDAASSESSESTAGGTPASYSGGSNGLTVCIDPGHQAHGISDLEPNGPGSTVMKAKLTTGTQGCATGIPEYEINLQVSLRLQAELQARGYSVVMIRTTNDCPSSNAERAMTANASGAQVFVRIHCNSLTDPNVSGIINYAPSPANPYLSQEVIAGSNNLAAILAAHMCAVTGAQNRGVIQDDGMTGINWCKIPVAIVEMGFMSNPTEDQLLANPDYQYKLAVGMANGIDAYFGR